MNINRAFVALIVCCVVVAFSAGRVLAQGAGGIPADPIADPATTVGILEQLWRSGAITSTVIVGGYTTLLALQRRVPWFAEGWRVVWVPAVLGGLTLLVDIAARGGTPTASMFVVALMTTIGSATQRKTVVQQLPSGEVRS